MSEDERRRYRLQDYMNAEADAAFRSNEEIIEICRNIHDFDIMTPIQKGARVELLRRRLSIDADWEIVGKRRSSKI
ncbi:hypothetical protein N6H05_10765 [Sphingobium sp. WTD-1]|uniref:hypothetical protein n=1 Tax=Sphingobium sp. WTD-1 TaxID=2979467 RepID=UPI0024DEC2C9|nr:hypothetical protein [Sphingobium sp. WTD-1]WIA58247.1 hypothetical protein N6H05_10765 [Sphingobium sp. WTD-1]